MSNQSELKIIQVVRKSLVAKQDLKAGAVLSGEMLACKRPGNGISPADLSKVIAMTIKKDKVADEVISWDDLRDE